jgi:hypothetical protein
LETALDLDRYTAIQQQQQKKREQMTEFLKAMQERMETDSFSSLQNGHQRSRNESHATKIGANQAEMKVMKQKIDASQEQMIAKMDAWLA